MGSVIINKPPFIDIINEATLRVYGKLGNTIHIERKFSDDSTDYGKKFYKLNATNIDFKITLNENVCVIDKLSYGLYYIYDEEFPDDEIQIEIEESKIYDVYLDNYNFSAHECTFGIEIDMGSSDPYNAVKYTGMSSNFSPFKLEKIENDEYVYNYGSWENIITEFFGIKPCLFNAGTRTVYLDPNDYSKTEDGEDADITSGESGDVMVEFKQTWYRFICNGDILRFEVSNYNRSEDGFVSNIFANGYAYYGAYEGALVSNKIRSLSGKNPSKNDSDVNFDVSFKDFKQYCLNNQNMRMENYAFRCYILGLIMLITKSRDASNVIGFGGLSYTDKDGKMTGGLSLNSGTMDKKGLFFGSKDCLQGVKCFGIENLWGSRYSFCSGIRMGKVTPQLIEVSMNSKDIDDELYTNDRNIDGTIVNRGHDVLFKYPFAGYFYRPTKMINIGSGIIFPSEFSRYIDKYDKKFWAGNSFYIQQGIKESHSSDEVASIEDIVASTGGGISMYCYYKDKSIVLQHHYGPFSIGFHTVNTGGTYNADDFNARIVYCSTL